MTIRKRNLLFQRMNAVVTLSAAFLFHRFAKVIMQETPAAHRTLPVLHHPLQLFLVLFNFLLRETRELFQFCLLHIRSLKSKLASTQLLYEFQFLQQRQNDAHLSFSDRVCMFLHG